MTTTGNTPGIGDVQAVGIPVTDQDRALRFYTDTLGFEVRMDVPLPQPDGRWITVAPPAARVVVALIAAGDRMPAGVETGIRFHTDGADAAHGALRARGVQVSELLRWPGVPAMFTVTDVDGNHFQIVE
jgi:lactoylglutathione lyase